MFPISVLVKTVLLRMQCGHLVQRRHFKEIFAVSILILVWFLSRLIMFSFIFIYIMFNDASSNSHCMPVMSNAMIVNELIR